MYSTPETEIINFTAKARLLTVTKVAKHDIYQMSQLSAMLQWMTCGCMESVYFFWSRKSVATFEATPALFFRPCILLVVWKKEAPGYPVQSASLNAPGILRAMLAGSADRHPCRCIYSWLKKVDSFPAWQQKSLHHQRWALVSSPATLPPQYSDIPKQMDRAREG